MDRDAHLAREPTQACIGRNDGARESLGRGNCEAVGQGHCERSPVEVGRSEVTDTKGESTIAGIDAQTTGFEISHRAAHHSRRGPVESDEPIRDLSEVDGGATACPTAQHFEHLQPSRRGPTPPADSTTFPTYGARP